ncbi:hypothetical protein LARI1_G008905, partial [Lachnellula arida]
CFSTLLLSTLLGGVLAANSKLNHHSDSNILYHNSPAEGNCYKLDNKTNALYLVTGSGAAAAKFTGTV